MNAWAVHTERPVIISCLMLPRPSNPHSDLSASGNYAYIRKHDKTLFSSLWLSGELNAYIENIDRQADEMFSQLVCDIAKNENVTERLKATDQMEWVRRMNDNRRRAEEIVNEELILR